MWLKDCNMVSDGFGVGGINVDVDYCDVIVVGLF